MIILLKKKKRIYEIILLLIPIVFVLEFVYVPFIGAAKTLMAFPSVNLLFLTATISEALIYFFIALGSLYALEKMKRCQKIHIAPKVYSIVPQLIVLFLLINLFTGVVIFQNPGLLQEVRVMLFPPLFFVIYNNVDIPLIWDRYIFKTLLVSLLGLLAVMTIRIVEPNFLASSFAISVTHAFEYWFALYIVILLFCYSAARLLFSQFSCGWFFVVFMTFANFIIRFNYKSQLFALLISFIVLFYFKAKENVLGAFKVVLIVLATGMLLFQGFIILPQDTKDLLVNNFAARYLKIGRVTNSSELSENIWEMAAEEDLSSSRFEQWKFTLLDSLGGYGLAPRGFGAEARIVLVGRKKITMKRMHSFLVYYAFHGGLITGFLVLILILMYMLFHKYIFSKLPEGMYKYFTKAELIGIFSFTVGIIAANMTGICVVNAALAWVFWFCVAILTRRWNIMKESIAH